jgi:hypothetical protein
LFGVPLILVGVVAAFMGPVEMYCFYLFSEGGPFYYEGFGFGSFMFGNIATQIPGYYVIAALAIPLGYAHLRLRRWGRPLAQILIGSWLVVGAPLALLFFLILVTAKDLPLGAVLVTIALLPLSYPLVPLFLLRFYRSRDVEQTFAAHDAKVHWLERQPLAVAVLCFLYLFYAVVLHVPILFNGIFPFFGILFYGLEGIVLLTVTILTLVCLLWGTVQRRPWAWWAAILFFGALTGSTILTFSSTSFAQILDGMRFAPTEMEMLQNVPLQGYHLAAFLGLPLVLTLVAILRARSYFGSMIPLQSTSSSVEERPPPDVDG